jgi:hypothetical protein
MSRRVACPAEGSRHPLSPPLLLCAAVTEPARAGSQRECGDVGRNGAKTAAF